MTATEQRRRELAQRARKLVQELGTDVQARETSIAVLMAEYGVSDRTALQFVAKARKLATR